MHGQPVPRGERERLHPGQLVSRELGAALEQEASGAAGPVVGVVPHRARVLGEGDQPGGVGLIPPDQRRVARVQGPDRLVVELHRRVEDVILGAVLDHLHDLRLPGVRVQHRAFHVGLGVFEQHPRVARGQVELDQPARVHPDRADDQQRLPVAGERQHVAGRGVVARDGQHGPPVSLGVVADQHVVAAGGQRGKRAADHHVLVGEPAGEPGVLDQLGQFPGPQVQPVDVVQLGVVPVHPDQDLVAVALAGGDDPGLDAVERRQVAARHAGLAACGGGGLRVEVDVVQPPVLVAAGVLYVQQVPVVTGPGEGPDATVSVIGDDRAASQPTPSAPIGATQTLSTPLSRRDPGQPGAVGGDVRTDALRVAEQHLARNEIDHGPCLPHRPEHPVRAPARFARGV